MKKASIPEEGGAGVGGGVWVGVPAEAKVAATRKRELRVEWKKQGRIIGSLGRRMGMHPLKHVHRTACIGFLSQNACNAKFLRAVRVW